ncbi:phage terminase large subunit (plasmid) [Thalassoporum mexicanum PCC 7367]|uniref:phage terminase large subunit n=1 Tax=Thalassoporum mexicanum TaxID=3457544 RepID=UPI00029F8675|nr:phage terminase large subunit [Pseudanabaena sp. PCC 7367]AFY72164.1 phage terminase large subunit [Pseudanabaena sp. PCC 7367]
METYSNASLEKSCKRSIQLQPLTKTTIEWQPIPNSPQAMAYDSEADELLYGGSAGGGKTDLICGLALTAHQRSLILRREATQLNGIIDRIETLAQTSVNQSRKTLNLGDRTIELGGCQHDRHKTKYKGREHDLKAFDELSEFTQSQYEFISAWNRSTDPEQKCRIVATSNPPDAQMGAWIIRHWRPWLDPKHPNPAISGEIRYFIQQEEVDSPEPVEVKGRLVYPRKRCFIAASVEDNHFLLDTGYDRLLDNLPPELAAKLRHGDFGTSIRDHTYQVIPTAWVIAAQERYRIFKQQQIANPPLSVIAIDPARGGNDRSAIAHRYGNLIELDVLPGQETPDAFPIIDRVKSILAGQRVPIQIDAIGVGAAVVDTLRMMSELTSDVVIALDARARSNQDAGLRRFVNQRAQWWWQLREMLDPANNQGEQALMLPDLPEVLADLTAPRWQLRLHGLAIEKKDQIKQRLGKSPDLGDAIVMALVLPPIVTYTRSEQRRSPNRFDDYVM